MILTKAKPVTLASSVHVPTGFAGVGRKWNKFQFRPNHRPLAVRKQAVPENDTP
jgi:hypothetical protein